ncbi:MAG: alpha-hydroxy acid oxidase [Bacteroidota bacterium]
MAQDAREKRLARLMENYPAIEDLQRKAKRRIPYVAWEYLEAGTGDERAMLRNREALDHWQFLPRFMQGELNFDLRTNLFGREYAAPFGVAPVGLTGLMWPKAECMLAEMAFEERIPFCLSTVATQIPEKVGPLSQDMGWFQLYPPKEVALRQQLLKRAKDSGFHTLIVTADVPKPARRERTKRAGLKTPPKITPGFIWQGITHPAWSIATLLTGLPRLRTVESHAQTKNLKEVEEFVRFKFRGNLTWDYLKALREEWDGPIILKGILHPDDAREALAIGLDGIAVSNHGGRQFNGAVAAIDALPGIVEAVQGKVPVLYDSGLRSGLDIMRALILGADFVLIGRPFLYGVAALGKDGATLATRIFKDDLINNMAQLGVTTMEELKREGMERVFQRR